MVSSGGDEYGLKLFVRVLLKTIKVHLGGSDDKASICLWLRS